MLYSRFTKEDVISYLKGYKDKIDKIPTRKSWRVYAIDNKYPSYTSIDTMFGGWNKALTAAGFEIRYHIPKASDFKVKADAKKRRCPSWKGGSYVEVNGYRRIWIGNRGDGKPGYMYEHRYVMSQIMGRDLESHELVHHKNGIKSDNRPENLELVSRQKHNGRIKCIHCKKYFSIP